MAPGGQCADKGKDEDNQQNGTEGHGRTFQGGPERPDDKERGDGGSVPPPGIRRDIAAPSARKRPDVLHRSDKRVPVRRGLDKTIMRGAGPATMRVAGQLPSG
jgi:hypothetical protein